MATTTQQPETILASMLAELKRFKSAKKNLEIMLRKESKLLSDLYGSLKEIYRSQIKDKRIKKCIDTIEESAMLIIQKVKRFDVLAGEEVNGSAAS